MTARKQRTRPKNRSRKRLAVMVVDPQRPRRRDFVRALLQPWRAQFGDLAAGMGRGAAGRAARGGALGTHRFCRQQRMCAVLVGSFGKRDKFAQQRRRASPQVQVGAGLAGPMQLEEADADGGGGDKSVLGVGGGGDGGYGGDGGDGGVLGGGEGGGADGGGDSGRGLGGAGVETKAAAVEAEEVIIHVVGEDEGVEHATTGKEPGLPEPSVLDASTLKSDESLAGRDFSGWTLKGDFSERNFAGAIFDRADLRQMVARHANFKDASMRGADASRADFRGACLVGVAVHGASLRRANCEYARMAGMWGGPECDEKPKVKPLEDGTMPPMEPLARTGEKGQEWDKEETAPGDTFTAEEEDADGEEDAEEEDAIEPEEVDAYDEAALEAHKRWLARKNDCYELADIVDMQHMNAT